MKQSRLPNDIAKECDTTLKDLAGKGVRMSFAALVALAVKLGLPEVRKKHLK